MHPKWAGRESDLNRQIREAALAGHGIVSSHELAGIGITRKMIQTRKDSERLIPVLNQVYALPGTRLTPSGRYRAAVSSAGPNVYLSHQSALALHGLVRDSSPVHLVGRAGAFRIDGARKWQSQRFGFGVECHQTRYLPDEHVTSVDGIPVTTVERALRDYAAVATRTEMSKALTQGEKMDSFCWGKLRAIVSSSCGRRGIGMLADEIEIWDPVFLDTASDPEFDFLEMLRRRRFPKPEVNRKIGDYVPDFLWRALLLAVELDPYGTHSGRASHRRDHRKGVVLETSGLRVIRFTGEDLYLNEDRTATELQTIMNQQASLHAQPIKYTDW